MEASVAVSGGMVSGSHHRSRLTPPLGFMDEKWEEIDMGLADGWDAPGQHVRVYAESLPELWKNIQEYLLFFKDTREISSASFETNKPGLTPAYDGERWSVVLTVHGIAIQETD